MPHKFRVSFSMRLKLLEEHLYVCDATIKHLDACKICKDDVLCPEGDEWYEKLKFVKARARLVSDEIG